MMKRAPHRFQIFWVAIFTVFYVSLPPSALGDSAFISESGSPWEASSVWKTGVGSGFRKDTLNTGLTAGAGFGIKIFGGQERHDLALVYGHVGWMMTDVMYENRWYEGNLELWGDVFTGGQYHPMSRHVFGLAVGPRYNFITGSRWVPFLDVGAGVSVTDIGEPDLSTTFQFNVQIGVGTHYFFLDDMALTLQIRGIHLSNAQIKLPNNGTNSIVFMIGATGFF
jgi:opacity protein-like surface antigen